MRETSSKNKKSYLCSVSCKTNLNTDTQKPHTELGHKTWQQGPQIFFIHTVSILNKRE